MNPQLVGSMESWSEPHPFDMSVLNADGEYAHIFAVKFGAEITIVGAKTADRRQWVIPISFPTLDQAQRAGKILADAFAAVTAIAAEDHPKPDDGHDHQVELMRFNRRLAKRKICVLCTTDLGEATAEEEAAVVS